MKQTLAAIALAATLTSPLAIAREGDLVETAVAAGSFETLVTALQAAGLDGALQKGDVYTVFAPSDEAFARIPRHQLEDLLRPENREKLTAILTYHVVPGRVTAADVAQLDRAVTLNGQQVEVTAQDGSIRIDEARVVSADVGASNGVIHVIDRVLMPNFDDVLGTAKKAGDFGTLLAAVDAAELKATLGSEGPFTVFAPRDAAFRRLPRQTLEALLQPENRSKLVELLTYHVVAGRRTSEEFVGAGQLQTVQGAPVRARIDDGRLRVNDARVVANDIDASNGVIHVIDRVLIPQDFTVAPSRTTPTQLIELAIDRGVPLFNRGEREACAAIYEVAARGLLAFDEERVASDVRERLQRALGQAADSDDASSRAWTLRRALDDSLQLLSHGGSTRMTRHR